jgi:hypothetical protein
MNVAATENAEDALTFSKTKTNKKRQLEIKFFNLVTTLLKLATLEQENDLLSSSTSSRCRKIKLSIVCACLARQ